MLLTLVGQAVASVAMLCEMPHMSQTQHAATNVATEKVHQQMSVSMMNMDCCDDAATGKNVIAQLMLAQRTQC